jgi:hypothetical protein
VLLQWQLGCLRPEDVELFHKRYAELLDQFIMTGQTAGRTDGTVYRLLLALYPTAHHSVDSASSPVGSQETE